MSGGAKHSPWMGHVPSKYRKTPQHRNELGRTAEQQAAWVRVMFALASATTVAELESIRAAIAHSAEGPKR